MVIVLLLIYSIIPLARETAIILLQGVPNFNFEALKRSLTNIGDVKVYFEFKRTKFDLTLIHLFLGNQ